MRYAVLNKLDVRVAFTLWRHHGMDTNDIAKHLGEKEAAVANSMSRWRERKRRQMARIIAQVRREE